MTPVRGGGCGRRRAVKVRLFTDCTTSSRPQQCYVCSFDASSLQMSTNVNRRMSLVVLEHSVSTLKDPINVKVGGVTWLL